MTRRVADPANAARVRLSYDIAPGPRTTFVAEGFTLSKSAVSNIERAWARSVVDDFLIEEVVTIARVELADAGYLLPEVTARIEGGGDARLLRVTVVPGQHVRNRRVEFSGNANEPSDRLLTALAERGLTRAVWHDPDAVQDALAAMYRVNGYLNAAVRVAPITIDGDTAVRPIAIVEGDAFRVGEVSIEGVKVFGPEEAARLVGLASGDRYRAARLEEAQLALDTQYRARGFNRVGIDYKAAVTERTSSVTVVVRVDEGPQQRLRDIETVGLTRTNPRLLSRALIELNLGEPVDLTAWNAARRRAYETGAFRSVDIQREVMASEATPSAGADALEPVRAKVTVQEWPPFRVRYGLEVRDELDAAGDAARANSPGTDQTGGRRFGLGLAGDLGARGLFGRAVSAGVAGRYALDSRAARAYVTTPLFFGRPIASTVFIERSREEFGAAPLPVNETFVTSLTFDQRIRLAKRTTTSYGYTWERTHTLRVDPDPLDPLPFDVTVTTGRFTWSAIFDTRDDPIDTSRGWFHSSSLAYAPAILGTDLRFARYFLQHQYYRRKGPVVLATAARIGLATAFGASLVSTQRFFAGGGNSVRGYAEDVLSPVDFGDVVGGNAVLVFNQEVRFPLFKMVRGVGFFDAGRAFDTVGHLSFTDLAPGAGLGLRVQTPFVLVRVDMGVPFDTAFGRRRAKWFFSIGQMF